jgi:vitamin K-dependent gamma-carboxylase
VTTTDPSRPAGDGPAAWSRLLAALFRPVDVAWLAALRVLFGLAMATSMARFIAYGWIDDFFVTPRFFFKYWGFGWIEPLGPAGMHALFWVLGALALAIAAGFCFRAAAWLFVVGFTYLQLVDVTTYLNHYYLASLLGLLLACSPAHRAWSVDAWLRPGRAVSVIPAGWHWLFRFQVAVVYTFAGIAKAHGDWLVHAQPLGIWLGSKTGMPVLGLLFEQPWAAPLMSWAGFLFDTTIAGFLLARRTRPFAYAAVIVFHALTSALFPIGMFPALMVMSALVFFPPGWPRGWVDRARRLFARIRGGAARAASIAPPQQDHEPAAALVIGRWGRRAVVAGLVYCAIQVAVPLRFLAYGGDVRWHEQGMRFSWRVMVREKNGSTTFIVRNKETGRIWHVSPRTYLTRLQEREMSGQPDLILQLSHRIRDDFEREGRGPVEVRADAIVSLNGRPSAALVDPAVDLAMVEDGLAPAAWILPRPTTAPIQLRPIPRTRPSRPPESIGARSVERHKDGARRYRAR